MSTDLNKAVVRAFVEAWNTKDFLTELATHAMLVPLFPRLNDLAVLDPEEVDQYAGCA